MDSCCNLGRELDIQKNILFETDNFFVVPTVGSIGIEGYLLLCSKGHYEGVGGIPEQYQQELYEVLEITRKVLSNSYNSEILTFEHGPRVGCHRGGGCLDHAHLHLVPIHFNLMEPLALSLLNGLGVDYYYKLERTNEFRRLREISEIGESSYMWVETNDGKRFLTEVNFPIPSQFIRQQIASHIRNPKWDWREYPDDETFEKTIEILQGKF